jgi:pimeloyl-ACP methyl ester carboxylesterase
MYLSVLGVVLLGAGLLIHQYPSRALAMLILVARALCGVKRRLIMIDGRNWTYLDSVKECPATLVLLHGFGADKDAWLPYARLLRKQVRVIAPDLPGFGESPMDPGLDYPVDVQCLRLQQFISGLGLGRVHLAGNSLGGFIATWFALTYPDVVASITLIDAAGMEGADKSETDLIIERGENPFAISDFASFQKFMSCVTYEQLWMPKFIMRALYLDALRRQSFLTGLFWKLLQDMRSRNLLGELHRLKAPTLVIWGREDRLVDVSSATAIHGRIPGSKLVILDRVGHAPMIEAPGVTAEHQGRFIAGLAGSLKAAAA